MEYTYTNADLADVIMQIIESNNLEEGYCRPLVYQGDENMMISAKGCKTNVMIACWESKINRLKKAEGITLTISQWVRPDVNMYPVDKKVAGNYTMLSKIKNEALSHGYDDAII